MYVCRREVAIISILTSIAVHLFITRVVVRKKLAHMLAAHSHTSNTPTTTTTTTNTNQTNQSIPEKENSTSEHQEDKSTDFHSRLVPTPSPY